MNENDQLKALLDECDQSHIYQMTRCLEDASHPIRAQLERIDLKKSIHNFRQARNASDKTNSFEPVNDVVSSCQLSSIETQRLESIAYNAIQAGHVAVVIMSGGQGTRLGYDGPKGMYDIGMPSHKSIFQLHIERILKIRMLAQAATNAPQLPSVPVYIMTSDLNHSQIQQYFVEQNHFGYPASDIIFFEQGLEPCFDFSGKILLDSAHSLSLAPDGNGGIYRALLHAGCVEDFARRNVQYLHVYGIDNVLTKSLDPQFIGLCISRDAECGNKVVWRAHRSEKVGVTATLNSRMHILEYSEIPAALADADDLNTGKLLFGAANICNHFLSVSFLTETALPMLSSTYHIAQKKIPFYDAQLQQTVYPPTNNGVKLEMFVFDVFPLAQRWCVFDVQRQDEFAPVKNAPGSATDAPETACRLLSDQAVRWLTQAGAVTEQSDDGTWEISPMLSYAGEGLDAFRGVRLSPGYYSTIPRSSSE